MRILVRQLFALMVLFFVPVLSVWAQWELDSERSGINFMSIKNTNIAESHSFSSMLGFIGKDGAAQVSIDLNSVQTLIDIRDERLREMLFKTDKFPMANIAAQIDSTVLQAVAGGGAVSVELPVTVSLHGVTKTVPASLVAVSEAGGPLRVFTSRPVVINAADFALEGSVAALQDIAGLQAISLAVPVTFHLVFTPAS